MRNNQQFEQEHSERFGGFGHNPYEERKTQFNTLRPTSAYSNVQSGDIIKNFIQTIQDGNLREIQEYICNSENIVSTL